MLPCFDDLRCFDMAVGRKLEVAGSMVSSLQVVSKSSWPRNLPESLSKIGDFFKPREGICERRVHERYEVCRKTILGRKMKEAMGDAYNSDTKETRTMMNHATRF